VKFKKSASLWHHEGFLSIVEFFFSWERFRWRSTGTTRNQPRYCFFFYRALAPPESKHKLHWPNRAKSIDEITIFSSFSLKNFTPLSCNLTLDPIALCLKSRMELVSAGWSTSIQLIVKLLSKWWIYLAWNPQQNGLDTHPGASHDYQYVNKNTWN
jgi:hypothetical protein